MESLTSPEMSFKDPVSCSEVWHFHRLFSSEAAEPQRLQQALAAGCQRGAGSPRPTAAAGPPPHLISRCLSTGRASRAWQRLCGELCGSWTDQRKSCEAIAHHPTMLDVNLANTGRAVIVM